MRSPWCYRQLWEFIRHDVVRPPMACRPYEVQWKSVGRFSRFNGGTSRRKDGEWTTGASILLCPSDMAAPWHSLSLHFTADSIKFSPGIRREIFDGSREHTFPWTWHNIIYETDAEHKFHPSCCHGNIITKLSNTHGAYKLPGRDFVNLSRTYLKHKKTKLNHFVIMNSILAYFPKVGFRHLHAFCLWVPALLTVACLQQLLWN